MARNFPLDSSFLTPPEKSFYQSIGPVVDGYLFKNSGCFGNSWSFCSFNRALEDNPCREIVNAELGEFDDPAVVVVDDILDRLPRDPFGMNIIKSTFPEISDWIQDFDWDFPSEYDVFGVDETHTKIDYRLLTGLYWGWNGAGNFPPGDNVKGNKMSVSDDVFDGFQIFDRSYDSGLVADGKVGTFLPTSQRDGWVLSSEAEKLQNSTKIDYDGEAGSPHDAMRLVLNYLGVLDLLSVEQVCRSLRDSVRGNPLLWWSIHIDQSLSLRITDSTLVKLTGRAQGFLQCLSLVDCIRITDSGLRCVLQSNPRLMKLSVPGCVRLTVEGILLNLRALKSSGKPGIKHLKIAEISELSRYLIKAMPRKLPVSGSVLLETDAMLPNVPKFSRSVDSGKNGSNPIATTCCGSPGPIEWRSFCLYGGKVYGAGRRMALLGCCFGRQFPDM